MLGIKTSTVKQCNLVLSWKLGPTSKKRYKWISHAYLVLNIRSEISRKKIVTFIKSTCQISFLKVGPSFHVRTKLPSFMVQWNIRPTVVRKHKNVSNLQEAICVIVARINYLLLVNLYPDWKHSILQELLLEKYRLFKLEIKGENLDRNNERIQGYSEYTFPAKWSKYCYAPCTTRQWYQGSVSSFQSSMDFYKTLSSLINLNT